MMADEEKLTQKDEHGCIIGEERWDEDLRQCVPIQKHPLGVPLGSKGAVRRRR